MGLLYRDCLAGEVLPLRDKWLSDCCLPTTPVGIRLWETLSHFQPPSPLSSPAASCSLSHSLGPKACPHLPRCMSQYRMETRTIAFSFRRRRVSPFLSFRGISPITFATAYQYRPLQTSTPAALCRNGCQHVLSPRRLIELLRWCRVSIHISSWPFS